MGGGWGGEGEREKLRKGEEGGYKTFFFFENEILGVFCSFLISFEDKKMK